MDWIEEIIYKWKRRINNTNLFRGMLHTVFLFLIGAIVAYVMTRNICYGWIKVIVQRYTNDISEFMDMELFSQINGVSGSVQAELFLLKMLYQYGLIIFILIAEYIGLRYYFKNKIIPGLEASKEAVGYLVLGDYGHEPTYHDKDEIGAICKEIETLQKQLVDERYQEWDAQKEQSSINAAFAHDIRTPLTVMKGYTEFLLKYVPQGKVSEEVLTEKLEIICKNQNRLLEFSKTMTEIQTMEMRLLHCKWCHFTKLVDNIARTAKELESQNGIAVQVTIVEGKEEQLPELEILVDESFIMETCENLLTNAFRYAIKAVEVHIATEDNKLLIFVKDDGKGFSDKALREAQKLYYSEEKGKSNHFGIGLYICQKLCEKHGGRLTVVNGIEGGAIAALEFCINRNFNRLNSKRI